MTDDQHDQLPLAASPVSAQVDGATAPPGDTAPDGTESIGEPTIRTAPRRRRGSRGGLNRRKPGTGAVSVDGEELEDGDDDGEDAFESDGQSTAAANLTVDDGQPELPMRI